MIKRAFHSLKNYIGRTFNSFIPPAPEEIPGVPCGTRVVAFVSQRWDYSSRFNGDGYEYKRFIPALARLSKTVHYIPLENTNGIIPALKLIKSKTPITVLSVFKSFSDIPEGYFDLKKEGYLLVNWYTDDDMQYEQFSARIAKNFNLNVTTYEPVLSRYTAHGACAFLTQWGGVEGVPFLNERKYLACFVGRMYNERRPLVRALKHKFGELVFTHDSLVRNLSESEMLEVYQNSWISIDEPSAFDRQNRQIKARLFETPSFGCVVATKPIERLKRYYEVGREVLFYNDFEELSSILNDCAGNIEKYKELAHRAYSRVQKEHLYRHRFFEIFKFLDENSH